MKKLCIFLFCFLLSFSLLSVRIGSTPLFTYIDQQSYPLVHATFSASMNYGKNLIQKVSDKVQEKREKRGSSLIVVKNRFGHQTYSAQEKEQLLEILSSAVQKNN